MGYLRHRHGMGDDVVLTPVTPGSLPVGPVTSGDVAGIQRELNRYADMSLVALGSLPIGPGHTWPLRLFDGDLPTSGALDQATADRVRAALTVIYAATGNGLVPTAMPVSLPGASAWITTNLATIQSTLQGFADTHGYPRPALDRRVLIAGGAIAVFAFFMYRRKRR